MDTPVPNRALADELIVIECQLGESGGFDALISRWQLPVWKYVRRLLGDDPGASDVAQDVWVRVIRGIGRVREPRKFSGWLFGVAHRTVTDHLRGKYAASAEIAVDVTELPDAIDEDDDDLERSLDRLDDALGALPIIEREALVLFYLRELSLIEMADVLAVPVGTVKSRLHRARKLLRRRLDGVDEEKRPV